jgi:RNA polymerase sigma factor (sigma-70 family)
MIKEMNCERRLKVEVSKGDSQRIRKAATDVFQNYKNLIYTISFGILGKKEEAEDATIETFSSFFSALNTNEAIRNPKYYLACAVRRISYRMKRNDERESSFDEDISGDNDSHINDFEAYEVSDALREIWTKEEAEIVVLHVIYDLSFRQIGEAKQKTVFSIAGIYSRAIKKAKEGLKNELD